MLSSWKKRLSGGSSDSALYDSTPCKRRMTGHGRAAAHPYQTLADGRESGERNVPFHETNPFHFWEIRDTSHLSTATYAVCRRVCKWVRSGKTNPFCCGNTKRQHACCMPCNRFLSDFCLLLEGSEDGVEFAGAEGAEDLGLEMAQGGSDFGESRNGFFAGG